MIGEYASVEDPQNVNRKANWITNAYLYTKAVFPKIKAITWFHIKKYEGNVQTDWRINSSTNALNAYKTAIGDSYFLGSIVTGIEKEENEIPEKFELFPAYPNPFNPGTKISFQIPYQAFVTMKIFDVLGREVTTLLHEEKPAGKYQVTFRAENLSSGFYFCQLTVNNSIKTMKLVLQK